MDGYYFNIFDFRISVTLMAGYQLAYNVAFDPHVK